MTLGRILTIDDQPEDLEILNHILERENYETVSARNGRDALDVLKNTRNIDVIVLDKMMPIMDGISFLRRLKEQNEYSHIPVIMQTGAGEEEDIMQGIDAGVHWYITKPFSRDVLCSIVKSAMRVHKKHNKMKQIADFYIQRRKKMKLGMEKLKTCIFEYSTMEEAKEVANALACCFNNPRDFVGAVQELLVNAVEHGNLGITFEEKSHLILDGMWEDEIEYREKLPENRDKKVVVTLKRNEDFVTIHIKDEGEGFDHNPFLKLDAARAHKANGRGIYLASLEFDNIQYLGKGNEVICYKKI